MSLFYELELSGSEMMHEHTHTIGQLPIDEIKKITCHFFDPTQVTAITATPAEAGLSGSQTFILKNLQTGCKHVLNFNLFFFIFFRVVIIISFTISLIISLNICLITKSIE